MTDDRVTRWSSPVSPGNRPGADPTSNAGTNRLPVNRPPAGPAPARSNPIPVRRAAANPVAPPAPSVADAHTEELPVMTDEEFEAAIAAAQRSAQAARDAEAAAEVGTPVPDEGPGERAAPKRRSLVAGLSGSLTAATVFIAAIAIAAQIVSSANGRPGPGWVDVAGQTVLAILAVLLQRRVDRRARRALAVLGVVGVTVLSFGVFWWAWLWLFWSV